MKKILKKLFITSLAIVITLISVSSTIFASKIEFSKNISYNSIEKSDDNDMFTYSSDNYNIIRHTMSTNSDEFLYFNGSAAEMSLSNETENNVRIMEAFFPGEDSTDTLLPLSIIGEDERQRVNDTTQSPYRAICRINSYYYGIKNNTTGEMVTIISRGTAFLSGPNLLLTAGHVIYGDKTSSDEYDDGIYNPRFPDKIVIQPGAYLNANNELVTPYGEFQVETCYIQKEYYQASESDYDWGICILNDNIGAQLGNLGLSASLENEVQSNNINVIGYPGDKNGDMYYSSGTVSEVTNTKFYHDADTTSGSSGSPVLVDGSNFIVQGIHTSGANDRNGATRITMFIFDLVNSLKYKSHCEILYSYYEGTSNNQYNCVLKVVYIPEENTQLLLSKDGNTFDKTITQITTEFYSSTTSSPKVDFDYSYYKIYYENTNTYSSVRNLHDYTDEGLSTRFAIKAKSKGGDKISTSFDQQSNVWNHGGKVNNQIMGTVVYNGEAKNIEVKIPLFGWRTSEEVTIGDATFQLRAGPNKVSIKANKELTCSNDIFFAFAVN